MSTSVQFVVVLVRVQTGGCAGDGRVERCPPLRTHSPSALVCIFLIDDYNSAHNFMLVEDF